MYANVFYLVLMGFFFENNFLIIENKFSKAGYHNKLMATIGETVLLKLQKFIISKPNNNPKI